jgi:hypothetical protein
VQRLYREGAGPLLVPGSDAVNAGTLGGAADWLLRFLVHPTPDLHLAFAGAANYIGDKMLAAVVDVATALGTTVDPFNSAWVEVPGHPDQTVALGTFLGTPEDVFLVPTGQIGRTPSFTGPVTGSPVASDLLARGCWALSLLTEVRPAGHRALRQGPLGRFVAEDPDLGCLEADVTADELLDLASQAAVKELQRVRETFEGALLPKLSARPGPWTVGPIFAGSGLVSGADGDLAAAGLLLEVKTALGRKRDDGDYACVLDKLDLFQVLGYALLDFEEWYSLDQVALFNARYARFVAWTLEELVQEISAGALDLSTAKVEFEVTLKSTVPDVMR